MIYRFTQSDTKSVTRWHKQFELRVIAHDYLLSDKKIEKKKKEEENDSSGNCSFNQEDQNIDFLFWTTIYELRKRYIDEKLEEILRLLNRPMNFIEFVNARKSKTWSLYDPSGTFLKFDLTDVVDRTDKLQRSLKHQVLLAETIRKLSCSLNNSIVPNTLKLVIKKWQFECIDVSALREM